MSDLIFSRQMKSHIFFVAQKKYERLVTLTIAMGYNCNMLHPTATLTSRIAEESRLSPTEVDLSRNRSNTGVNKSC